MSSHPLRVRYAADITPPRYGSLAEAAEYLGCNERTVRRYIAAGKLRGYRLGGLLRVDLNEVDAAMAPIPTAGGGHGAA